MGKPDDAKRKWLQDLGVMNVGPAVAELPSPDAVADEYSTDVPLAPRALPDLNSLRVDPATMQKILAEGEEKARKEALERLEQAKKALADAKAFIAGLSADKLQAMGYAKIMAEVRKRFPDAANLAALVKDTSQRVPSLKGKLPPKEALMNMVKGVIKDKGLDFGMTMLDPKKAATELLLAAYMSELPSGVNVDIVGGVVQITTSGAALAVKTPAGEVAAKAGKAGAEISLKAKDYNIEVTNEGWKEFDPKLRANWQRITDEASQVAKLEASLKEVKAEFEKKKKAGEEIKADVKVDIDKREAEFNLRWKKLQEEVKATATASEKKLTASIEYLKKDKNNKEAVKAGADLEVDLKAMQGKLKAYYTSPSVKAVLDVTASAEKVSAKLEVAAAKSGVVVTASFEKALDETKAAIEVMLREGKTKIAAELKQKADDLSAKLKVVHETKDLKLAAELEKTLKDVRTSIEVEYTRGKTTVKAGATASSSGEVGGKAQIDIVLDRGHSVKLEGAKLSLTADVSTRGYNVGINFSMGEPVKTESVEELIKTVDQQIKELYKLAGDQGVRSLKDAQALQKKFDDVMAPVKAAAEKAKTVKKKSEIEASFGFSLAGEWPAGGKASPPTPSFGLVVKF